MTLDPSQHDLLRAVSRAHLGTPVARLVGKAVQLWLQTVSREEPKLWQRALEALAAERRPAGARLEVLPGGKPPAP